MNCGSIHEKDTQNKFPVVHKEITIKIFYMQSSPMPKHNAMVKVPLCLTKYHAMMTYPLLN
jgi:hypothetical protein